MWNKIKEYMSDDNNATDVHLYGMSIVVMSVYIYGMIVTR